MVLTKLFQCLLNLVKLLTTITSL